MRKNLLALLLVLIYGLVTFQTFGQPANVPKTNSLPVYMHYMPWFDTPETSGSWGYHWTMRNRNPNNYTDPSTGRRDIASHYYPLIGPYGSSDPDVVEYHLLLMKLSGVDGVLIDWYGVAGSNGDINSLLRNSNALIDRTDETGMKFGLVLEDRFTGSVSNAKSNVSYARNNYFNRPQYIRYGAGNDPLMGVFGPITFNQPYQWSDILSSAGEDVEFLTLWYESGEAGGNADGEYMWIFQDGRSHIDHVRTYYTNRALQMKTAMGVAYPGFHDFYAQGGAGNNLFYIPHNNGATLDQLFSTANQYRGNMDMLQLATFNDFGEGTMFEPTREFGFSYLVKLQRFTGVPYTEYELRQVHRLYNLRKQYKGDGAKQAKLNEAFNHFVALRINEAVTALNCVESGSCNVTQTPYTGSSITIPGTVEAENFDKGGEGVSYHDNDGGNTGGQYRTSEAVDIEVCNEGGYNVGWTNPGEWMEYTVNVTAAGNYKIDARVATQNTGGTLHIEFGGADKTGIMSVPTTGGWQTWTTVSKTGVSLSAGTQVMRVYLDNGNFNLNRIIISPENSVIAVTGVSVSPTTASLNVGGTQQLTATVAPANATNKNISWSSNNTAVATVNASGMVTAVGNGSAIITVTTQDGGRTASSSITVSTAQSQSPFTGTPISIPGTVESENYDNGGEGIAYHDNDAANSGGQYRTSLGVDIEACNEGGYNVGWTNPGEWLEYTVNVTAAGIYDFDVRVATINSGGTLHVEFNGVNKTGLMSVSATGGWQTWTSVTKTGVFLDAGTQVMRVYLDNGNFNINKITISGNAPVAVTGVSVSPATVSIPVGSTQQLAATISPSNATNKNVTWTSSNTAVATVSAAGLVTAVAQGSATITATTQDGAKTALASVSVTAGNTATIYRIKNRWQNTYLYDAGDRVRYSATASGANYQWVLEDVNGVKELKNVGTGEYMHIENRYGYIQCTSRTPGWGSSRWTMETVSTGIVRFKNAWQTTHYIHIENLQNQAQHGTINSAWWSAQWVLEPVNVSAKVSEPSTQLLAKESFREISATLSPNPVTSGMLTVETADLDGDVTVRISNELGREMYMEKTSVVNGTVTFDLSHLQPGTYILHMQGNEVVTKKFIVQ